MADQVPFPPFHYDDGRAEAMAEAIRAVFAQARRANVTVPDKLAALGLAAAREIHDSKLRGDPQKAAQALADYVVAWATRLRGSAQTP